ncbi:signal peptide peptidase SppA, 36K type [compost metagenome]
MRKVGVERRAYTSGEHKAFLDQFQPENEAETEFWKAVLQNTHQQFIAAVQAGRGDRLQATNNPELFSGLIWTGEQALKMGLVDKLGDADFVAREMVGESRVVDYTRKGSALDRFANKLGTSLVKELGIQLGIMGSPELR